MSVRSDKAPMNPNMIAPGMEAMAMAEGASTDQPLAEGNSYSTASPENPLTRNVVVSIKASLNDFCLQKTRGTWAPSQEALRSIFQQRRFTTLDGSAEPMGGCCCRCPLPALRVRLYFSTRR